MVVGLLQFSEGFVALTAQAGNFFGGGNRGGIPGRVDGFGVRLVLGRGLLHGIPGSIGRIDCLSERLSLAGIPAALVRP